MYKLYRYKSSNSRIFLITFDFINNFKQIAKFVVSSTKLINVF